MNLTSLTSAVRRQTSLTTSDVSDADIMAIINEGIQEVCGLERWDFLHTKSTISVTASTVEVNLPSDFRLMGFVQQAGERDGPLIMLSFNEYSYRFGDNAATGSKARYFYMRTEDGTQKIGFYPTPSATATDEYEIYYYKAPTLLTTGTDVPPWDDQFHKLLVDYASYRLWEREEYFDESERAFRRYTRQVGDMTRYYRLRFKQSRFIVGDGAYYGGWNSPRRNLGFD